MLNSIANNQNLLKPESLYAVTHRGVVANTIHSQVFSFGGLDISRFKRTIPPLCACGCGEKVTRSKLSPYIWNKFITGHNNKNKRFSFAHRQKQSIGMKKAWLKRTSLPITYKEKLCPICKKIFFVPLTKKGTLFCSMNCFKKHCSITRTEKNNPMYGTCGEMSPNWMGGISFEPYPIDFNANYKNKVRQIDSNICQLCEKTEDKKLDIHHIDYVKKNIEINNLVSLCRSCHMKTNYNRKCWTNYFRSRLNAI